MAHFEKGYFHPVKGNNIWLMCNKMDGDLIQRSG